jgi:hypothetical protein
MVKGTRLGLVLFEWAIDFKKEWQATAGTGRYAAGYPSGPESLIREKE